MAGWCHSHTGSVMDIRKVCLHSKLRLSWEVVIYVGDAQVHTGPAWCLLPLSRYHSLGLV